MGNLEICHDIYGKQNFEEFKRRLIGGLFNKKPCEFALVWTGFFARFGIDDDGRKTCRPTVTKSYYNSSFDWIDNQSNDERKSWRMKRQDVIEHLVAEDDQIERMTAYVNRCPIIGDSRIGLFCFDIDNHKKLSLSNVQNCKRLIERVFKGSKIYWERSTTGSGLHGYILISWHYSFDNSRIRSEIRELQCLVGQITAHLRTRCDEIRGIPHSLHKRKICDSGYGEWAKLPRPRTGTQMEEFLSATNQHSSCSELISRAHAFLGYAFIPMYQSPCFTSFLKDGNSEQPSTQSRPFTQTRTTPSSSPLLCKANVLGCNPPLDTKERTLEFASGYFRSYFQTHGYLPPYCDLQVAYMKAGLMIGNSDDRCLRSDYKYLSKTFDESKSKRSVRSYLSDAEVAINLCLKNNGKRADLDLDRIRRRQIYKRRGCADSTISRLYKMKRNELSQVYACMLYELSGTKSRQGTFGKQQCSQLLKQVFGTKIDGKEFKAIMRWLRRNKLVRVVMHHRSGVCRKYELVEQAV